MATLLDSKHIDASSSSAFRGSMGYASTESTVANQIRIPLVEDVVRPGSNITFNLPRNLGVLTNLRLCFQMNITFPYYPQVTNLLGNNLTQAGWSSYNALTKQAFPTWNNSKPTNVPLLFLSQRAYALDFPVNMGAFSVVSKCSLETETGFIVSEYNDPYQLEKWMQFKYTTLKDTEMRLFDQETQGGICQPQTMHPNLQPAFNVSGKNRAVTYKISDDSKEITFTKQICVPFPLTFGADKLFAYMIGNTKLMIDMAEISPRVLTSNIQRVNGYLDLREDFAHNIPPGRQLPTVTTGNADAPNEATLDAFTTKSILGIGVAVCNPNPAQDPYTNMTAGQKFTVLKLTLQGLRCQTGDITAIIGDPSLHRQNASFPRVHNDETTNPASTLLQVGGVLYVRLAAMDLPTTGMNSHGYESYPEAVTSQGFAKLLDRWVRVPIHPSNIAKVILVGNHESPVSMPSSFFVRDAEKAINAIGKENSVFVQFCTPISLHVPVHGVNLLPIVNTKDNDTPPNPITARKGGYGTMLDDVFWETDTVIDDEQPLPLMYDQNLGFQFMFNIGEPIDAYLVNSAFGTGGGTTLTAPNIPLFQLKSQNPPDNNNPIIDKFDLGQVVPPDYSIVMPTTVTYTNVCLQASKQILSDGVAQYLKTMYETSGVIFTAVVPRFQVFNVTDMSSTMFNVNISKTVAYFFTLEVRTLYNPIDHLPIGYPTMTFDNYRIVQGSYEVRNVKNWEQNQLLGGKLVQPVVSFKDNKKIALFQKPSGPGPSQYVCNMWAQAFGNALGESEATINNSYLASMQYFLDGIYSCQTRDGGAHFAEKTSFQIYFKIKNDYPGNSMTSTQLLTQSMSYTTNATPDAREFTTVDATITKPQDTKIPLVPLYVTAWCQEQLIMKEGQPLQAGTAPANLTILE